MKKEIIFSNIGFFLGIIGVVMAVISFFTNMNGFQRYSLIILPIMLGVGGLILVFKIKKRVK